MLEADDHPEIFVSHDIDERTIDLGEIRMNYASVGSPDLPALLLIPGQTESWWGYEQALPLLGEHFHAHAVDLRGQGRSTWTPGRYSLNLMGDDLVRFIDGVIGRSTIVSGNSSGGVLAAWLSAYAKPGQIAGVVMEDPPVFASEIGPDSVGCPRPALAELFPLVHRWLGDQGSTGDWESMQASLPAQLSPLALETVARMGLMGPPADPEAPAGPPQNLREYDPEWARAFTSGEASAACDQSQLMKAVRTPVLVTHHFRKIDAPTGSLMGAASDEHVARAGELVRDAGQTFEVVDLPEMTHAMHHDDPARFTEILRDWAQRLVSTD